MTTEFAVGQHVGDYEILSVLGVGGMGKVYKVRNVISDRAEAMKILLPDLSSNQSLADRFLREIRVLAALDHPNIAALRTALNYQNQLVMIMEFVEGETLANRLARAPLSTAEAANYADQVLSALSYAHKQKVIHRDIKPANMMLTPHSVVKLMDFGIARSSVDGSLTSTGTTLGSLNYMPPEQVRGEAADARSDIYSFGVSLYEMLTGKLPFKGDSQYSLMTAQLNQTPVEPITLRSDLPTGLNEIIMMAIAKDPASRFQSADAIRAALKSIPVSALPAAGTTVTPTPSSGQTTIVDTPLPRRATAPTPPPPAARTPTPPPAVTPALTVPVTPPSAAVPPPSAATAGGHRGLWLALGAMLGVFVLIAAGMYVPRHFGTHADPKKAAFPSNGADNSTAPAAPGSSRPSSSSSLSSSPPLVSLQGADGSIKVDSNGNVSLDSPTGGMHVDAKTGAVTMTGKGGTVAVKPPKSDTSPTTPPTPQSDVPAVPPIGPSSDDLDKAEDEADKLNVRAEAATNSVETLRKQQMAAGYNLRADIASSEERMQVYLAKGNAALKAQDLKNAQKYFDLADAELTKLEKFLGH
jgi:eukaryotic-like serine/threonine-protein kinase